MIVKLDMRHETSELSYEGIILGCQAVSFVERFAILYPYLGESTIGDSTSCNVLAKYYNSNPCRTYRAISWSNFRGMNLTQFANLYMVCFYGESPFNATYI